MQHSHGKPGSCQISTTAMASDTSRSWPHIWRDMLFKVHSAEYHMHGDTLHISACPRHSTHYWSCPGCYACLRITVETAPETLPANDMVYLRRMLVAAVWVLKLHNEPVSPSIVSHMLRGSLQGGLQFVPEYVSRELFNAGRIDNPFPLTPHHGPPSPSSSRSSASSLSSTLSD
jgi:hypothetical protein